MSASDVMSMLTTRTLILLFTLRISALVASSFAMLRLARTMLDAEALANSSAIAWIQDRCWCCENECRGEGFTNFSNSLTGSSDDDGFSNLRIDDRGF